MEESLFFFWVAFSWYIKRKYRAVKHYEFMRYQWIDNPARLCHICGERVTHRERSIDHIIPESVCYELGLYGLLTDHRNLALAHADCNYKKGSKLINLPPDIKLKIYDIAIKNNLTHIVDKLGNPSHYRASRM